MIPLFSGSHVISLCSVLFPSGADHDLKIARKTLKTREQVDGKGKLQKFELAFQTVKRLQG